MAAQEALGDRIIPTADRSAQRATGRAATLSAAVDEHREVVSQNLGALVSGGVHSGGSAAARARVESMMRSQARVEDDVLSRHPNLYGRSILDANNFLVRAEHDPVLRQAIQRGEPEAIRVRDACARLIADARDESLDADGISHCMEEMEGGGKWSATTKEQSAMSEPQASRDVDLSRRAAALSAVWHRSSDPAQSAAVGSEFHRVTQDLTALRLQSLG